MSTLDVCIANYINCHRRELFVKLSDPTNHSKVVQHFEGMRLITAYKNKEGKYKEFVLRDISLKGADEQYAYNGFMGITVKQHYFVRHDFVLRYPVNPCAIEITGKNDQHYNYFPLETVKLATFSPCVSDARRYLTKFIRRPFQKNSEAKNHEFAIKLTILCNATTSKNVNSTTCDSRNILVSFLQYLQIFQITDCWMII